MSTEAIRDGQSFTLPGGMKIRISINAKTVQSGVIKSDEQYLEIGKQAERELEKNAKLPESTDSASKKPDSEKSYAEKFAEILKEERDKVFPKIDGKPAKPEFTYYQDSCVYLVSDDSYAVMTCSKIVRECTSMFKEFYGNDVSFLRLIVFQIMTPEKLKATGADTDFKIGAEIARGCEITISAKWDSNASLNEICNLLTGAYIRRMSYENGKGVKDISAWQESALSLELYRRLKNGAMRDYALAVEDLCTPSMADIFQSNFKGEVGKYRYFWAFKAFEQLLGANFSDFLKLSINTTNSNKSLKYLSEKISPILWSCVYHGEIYARLGGVLTPMESARAMENFVSIQYTGEDGERVGVSDFRQMRILAEKPDFLAELSRRISELKVSLTNINPLWYNSAISLGKVYTALLEGKDEEDFNFALAEFKSESDKSFSASKRASQLLIKISDKEKRTSSNGAKNNLDK